MTADEATSVKVAVRIRPQLAREKIEACRICTYVTPGEPQVTLGNDKSFTYDYVFDTPTEQQSVYDNCITSLINGCFEGYNATVLAYGQTGSGKTYTMGTGFDVTTSPEQLGIVPRAMGHLFAGINKRKKEAIENGFPQPDFVVTAQFMELYNEELIDLFDTTRDPNNRGRSSIRIHEDASGNIYTAGVTSRQVASAEEILQCLHSGALNRSTAATQMNSQSSRSHAIFTVTVKQTRARIDKNLQGNAAAHDSENENDKQPSPTQSDVPLEFETLSAKFHFTDLAGSERLKRTGATGDRAKEGISINCGLLALGNVISALGDPAKKSSHVPYRDSKLTRLLQDSLGGNSCTLMVACISPSDSDFMETLSTLRYANRAKNIKNKVSANQDSASKQIQFFRQQIAALQLELTEYKTGKRMVGEDGVEAYNDMFQENNMLQKENNNFRMKIKAMQETLDNRNQKVISLTMELAQVRMGNAGDNNEDAVAMIGNYVKEIEELRSKLVESEALCSSLRRKSEGISPYGLLHRSPTPMMVTSSFDYESSTMLNGKSVLNLAKEDIEKLEIKKDDLKKRKATRPSDKTKEENASSGDVNGHASEQSASEDDETSELEDIDVTSSDDESDDAVSAAHQEEFATITYEIDVKQGLVNELEAMQRRMAAMQRQYEEKLKMMAETIKATELERDKVLKNLDSKSSGGAEKSNKIKAEYKKQIDKMKKDMNKLQEAKKNHDRLVREQSKSSSQLKSLRSELEQLKKSKVRLMRQMKEDQKRSKVHESKHLKEMTKLKREFKLKSNEVRTLSSQNRQKDLMMKRKQEEVSILRKQLKPISGKFGKRQQAQQLKQQQLEGSRTLDSTYVVDKNGTTDNQSKDGRKRVRKASSEFSSKTARIKLQKIQQKIEEAVVQRETVSRIDRQMERLLKDRERMQRDLERSHRKKAKALVDKDKSTLHQFKEEESILQENIDFVNEQIHECQLEVMQVEEAMDDNGVISSIVQYCTVNEARYMLENLIGTAISKSAVNVQTQNRLKDAESRLEVSEESAKQAHDLMRYILQERPNLDSSIADCLNDYMKATNSESTCSSRESSPGRDEVEVHDSTAIRASSPQVELMNNSDGSRLSAKEIKARRRTATPQELLHGMTSPIRSTLSPIESPISEKTFVCEDLPKSGLVTSTPEFAADDTLTPNSSALKMAASREDKAQESDPPKTRIPTVASDLSRSASVDENSLHPSIIKSNSAPATSRKQSPNTESPPESPVSSRSKGAIPGNVFSRLTSLALSSPRSDKGRMNPYQSKAATPRSEPLVCAQVAEGHHKAVLCVQANDHLLFSGSKDRTVKVWNLVTGQEIMSLDGHPNNVNVVRYCPLTGLVYSVSLCYIKVWDIRSHARCVRVLSSSGGHQLPSNFQSSISRTNRMPDNEAQVNDVKLSADRKLMYCASTTQVKIWDLNKFSVVGKLTGHSGNIMTMSVPSNHSDTVITGAKDHFVKVYDIPRDVHGVVSPSKTLEPPHMDGVESFAFSPSENVLFSGSRDKSIKKWDMTTKSLLKSEYQAHANWVCALDIIHSSDGDELLVSGGRGGILKLWDLHSFGSIGSIRAHSDTINYIASNKTHIFTASSDSSVKVWKRKPER